MSVLSALAGSIDWPVRWARWGTDHTLCAWALGPSEAPKSESDGGFWPTPNAADAHRGPESRATKKKRGAGGINQAHAVVSAKWQTPLGADGGAVSRGGARVSELLLGGQVKAANWATGVRGDADRASATYARGNPTQLGQVKAANWQTCVVMDKEQSGSSKRGPTQTSQVREASWFTPQARDWKDTGPTQGNRKSPNLGTQVIRAAGPTCDGKSPTSEPPAAG